MKTTPVLAAIGFALLFAAMSWIFSPTRLTLIPVWLITGAFFGWGVATMGAKRNKNK